MTNDRSLWLQARTLADLGELTAQWLEGTVDFLPAYYNPEDGPDGETRDLVPVLAAANRAGYVTTMSQPGQPLTGESGQRACVDGFCSEDLTEKIKAVCLGTDLVAITTPPGWDNPTQVPVTIDDSKPFTWVGAAIDEENIEHYYREDCPNAITALTDAWQVVVFDPQWGRNDLLWQRLAQAWA